MHLPLGFIIYKEKRLILLEGPTHRGAELVQIELLAGGREVAARIQSGVAEELEDGSVQLVGSRLGCNQHGRTRTRAVLGREVVAENLEFLNGIDRRQNGNSASGQFVVVVA